MSKEGRRISVTLGGKRYHVVTTASQEELEGLVALVEEKARAISGGKGGTSDGILLAALAFAHEAQLQRDRANQMSEKAQALAEAMLAEIGELLGETDAKDQENA
jgi:cell division protein ZapA (FtsZ GTPase activity inhibitor)